ncbi:MAG TPA: HNH endonuclease [Burkholderiaceae bacterium]|nr:HNH endonuclease [Burkholderiaceae bacterium]
MVARRSLRVSREILEAGPLVPSPPESACPLCGRPLPDGPSVDLHHPRPRSLGGTATVRMHRICHRKLHATFTERELAAFADDWDALRAQPEIAAFVRWVGRRPGDFYDGSRKAARLRRR